jgi:nucleoside-diphosphate-sugar epimerase
MARYLLTGAAGFIGAQVARHLLDMGATVVGIDNLNDSYDPRLKAWRLDQFGNDDDFTFVKANIANREELEQVFDDGTFDGVINLAARAGVRQSVSDPWVYYETNVNGALNLLDACRARSIPKIVQASTSSLYGLHNPRPLGWMSPFCVTLPCMDLRAVPI